MILKRIWNLTLDILFPPLCFCCKKHLVGEEKSEFLCLGCQNQIEISNSFFCPECHRRLPEVKKSCHPETKFILAAASFYKNPVVRELVHTLKYQGMKNALVPLAKILNLYIDGVIRNWPSEIRNFIVVPIPLHFKKERERGFNQATLIAQAFALVLHDREAPALKIETNNLVRVKTTKSQTDLENYEERAENVSGCFALKQPEKIKGANIILIDDVFTSGATMKEAVRVLKSVGARKIIGFVIARA